MADPRWLDETEARAWRGQLRMSWLLSAAIARDLAKDAGLSSADYEVLVNLSESDPHRMRISELATRMFWSKSRLSHQLSRMEARGLIARAGCDGDARGAFAVLTDNGMRAIEDAAPGHVESVRRHLFDQLDRDQVASLAQITETIVDHLSGSCTEAKAACDEVEVPCDEALEA